MSEIKYGLVFLHQSLKQLKALPADVRRQIGYDLHRLQCAEEGNLTIKKLTDTGDDLYRLRSGSYRVVYKKQNKMLIIEVISIGDRKEVYRK